MAAKYDPDSEAEVISWFKQLFDVELQPGMRDIENQLRDGQLLVRYQRSIIIIISSSSIWLLVVINYLQSPVVTFSRSHVGTSAIALKTPSRHIIPLDNKDVASLTLLGVSYIFLASDHENHC